MRDTTDLEVGVVGAGLIGLSHVRRISKVVRGARVSAVVEPDSGRLSAALAEAPGAVAMASADDLLAEERIDALVVATYGDLHEPVLLGALERGLPVFVEKPLTRDSASSLRVVEAELRLPWPLIQVGFMRRFDSEYLQLKEMIDGGGMGRVLMLHMAHRLATYRDGATASMPILDALVHEIDMAHWLLGEPFVAIEVKRSLQNRLSDPALPDPQFVILETCSGRLVTVELNVGVQFGYQATTEAVCESAVVYCGRDAGPVVHVDGMRRGNVHAGYATRFEAALTLQVQHWVEAARHGHVDGATAWDGYMATRVAEAGVRSQETGQRISLDAQLQPEFYRSARAAAGDSRCDHAGS